MENTCLQRLQSGIFTGNSIIESLLSEVASLVWGVQDLIVEDGEVEGKTKADGVCWGKVSLSNFGSHLVSLKGLVSGLLSLVANSKFSKITVVVTLPLEMSEMQDPVNERDVINSHLVIEDLGLAALSGRNQVLLKNLKNVLADLGKLGLNLLAVLLDQSNLCRVTLGLLLLLN